eukprot:TRINITY_DN262_c0_g1_i8.p1 TRINITY_DN262_c0_g1~~TRINITY_DN262_c0_g1_i8.p1  ORF type:complete len:400 (-),score=123.48 TRINITY_DN262_c0_g1_i8:89-1135(-)
MGHAKVTIKEQKSSESQASQRKKVVQDNAPIVSVEKGDLEIKMCVQDDANLFVRGYDIHMRIDINLVEAFSGVSRTVQHPMGYEIILQTPKGTTIQPQSSWKVSQEGLYQELDNEDGPRGDLIVHLNLVLPESVNISQCTTMQSWGWGTVNSDTHSSDASAPTPPAREAAKGKTNTQHKQDRKQPTKTSKAPGKPPASSIRSVTMQLFDDAHYQHFVASPSASKSSDKHGSTRDKEKGDASEEDDEEYEDLSTDDDDDDDESFEDASDDDEYDDDDDDEDLSPEQMEEIMRMMQGLSGVGGGGFGPSPKSRGGSSSARGHGSNRASGKSRGRGRGRGRGDPLQECQHM